MSNEAIRRMLQVGDDYAIRESKHAYRPARATYLGDAPYSFGGSTQAKLYSARRDTLEYEDGCYYIKRNDHRTRMPSPAEVLVGDTMWLIAPNTSGWHASPYGGNGVRGMFAVKNDDGEVTRIAIVAYGVNIVSPWDVEEKRQAEMKAHREQEDRRRQTEQDWVLALAHEVLRICDERGYTDKQIDDVLDDSRENIINAGDKNWRINYRTSDRAYAFLVGGGVIDPVSDEE